ncbi:GNAT family N-acetyltransferase [Aquibacillus koreensis]|uniref:GNAT family N-acetyltransferase n=1 Tax=Aquibacillus koreensis TaxID=279446 RepID=A0A9X3WNI5_9BACI|nr:GNAT family protein [Aquibacillus koreensis]MCT2536044.1 GNAT family N-acetyltransferase [Aquibacillus koreensis]MDC3420499.1 GNAT family N-acetyltransferase [Aquibacillus koreensis]
MEIADIYGSLPTLETERLILRKVTLQDVEDMYQYGSNPEVSKYVTWDTHQSLSDSKGFIEFIINQYEDMKIAPWGIEYKANSKFIGTVDFVWWEPKQQTAEIGYVIAKECWGKGLTTEAAKALIKFGFQKMDLVRIQARCSSENIGSQRVMEKAGMTYEGTMRKAMLIKGEHRNLKLYSILREEYLNFGKR